MSDTKTAPSRVELVRAIGDWAEAHRLGVAKQLTRDGEVLTHALDLLYGRLDYLERAYDVVEIREANAFDFVTRSDR